MPRWAFTAAMVDFHDVCAQHLNETAGVVFFSPFVDLNVLRHVVRKSLRTPVVDSVRQCAAWRGDELHHHGNSTGEADSNARGGERVAKGTVSDEQLRLFCRNHGKHSVHASDMVSVITHARIVRQSVDWSPISSRGPMRWLLILVSNTYEKG